MPENDLLLKKLEQELKDYKEYVKEQGVDYAIESAYKITVKKEILDNIIYDNNYTEKQIKTLLKCDNILEQCYDEWFHADGNLRETLDFSVNKRINSIVDNSKKDKIKAHKEAR